MPHNLESLYIQLQTPKVRRDCLPNDSLPKSLSPIVLGDTDEIDILLHYPAYDVSFWLLKSAQGLHSFALSSRIVEEFNIDSDEPDDNHPPFDEKAELVRIMRSTLFMLPLSGKSFVHVQKTLREQWCYETPELAAHNLAILDLFIERINESTLALTAVDSDLLIDVFAYDSRYIDDQTIPRPVGDDDGRPRFVERAARGGFASIHRRAFGTLAIDDDKRAPALRNIDRVTLPETPGQWRTARVRVESNQQLAVVPLGTLVTETYEKTPKEPVVVDNTDAHEHELSQQNPDTKRRRTLTVGDAGL
jgi:hypothetical protein